MRMMPRAGRTALPDGFVLLKLAQTDAWRKRYIYYFCTPDRLAVVNDFSGDAGVWMAAVEQELCSDVDESSRLAIGFLDFETAAFSTLGIPVNPCNRLLRQYVPGTCYRIIPNVAPGYHGPASSPRSPLRSPSESTIHMRQKSIIFI